MDSFDRFIFPQVFQNNDENDLYYFPVKSARDVPILEKSHSICRDVIIDEILIQQRKLNRIAVPNSI